jgi:DNA gyrase subunit A
VRRVKEGEKVVMVSSAGKAIRFDESEARPMGRDTSGVKGMTTPKGARVLGMEIAPVGSDLFVITENGFGKRTPMDEYTEHHRGGSGMTTISMTAKKGQLASMKVVLPGHELMIVSEEGVVIRVNAKDISQLGRATQGVKVMNVSSSDRVCAVARVAGSKKKTPANSELEGQATIFEGDDFDPDDDLADVDSTADELDEGEVAEETSTLGRGFFEHDDDYGNENSDEDEEIDEDEPDDGDVYEQDAANEDE